MRGLGRAAAALLLAAACGGEPTPEASCAAEPATRFEGVWAGYEEGRGEGEWTLLVTGTCFLLSGPGNAGWMKGAATFPAEGDRGPADLWIEDCDCPDPGMTALALFELRGDELRIAGARPGTPARPTSFDAPGARAFRLRRRAP